ncbi:hypothetical protein BGX24_009649 [Mortierella sp. AD032]|nr:hypothetical protein BGX24_009649 [Mortierella sp. AD032]
MKFSAILVLAAIAAVTSAQTCWDQLDECQIDSVKKRGELRRAQDAEKQCRTEKAADAEQARCWQCAYTEVQRCVDASGGNPSFPGCYKNGLRMRKFCLEGQKCGYERPGEIGFFQYQK